jgi:hypothetical protein
MLFVSIIVSGFADFVAASTTTRRGFEQFQATCPSSPQFLHFTNAIGRQDSRNGGFLRLSGRKSTEIRVETQAR